MKNALLLFAFALATIVASCSKSKTDTAACQGGAAEFALDVPFTLCYGTSASMKGNPAFVVSFDEVYGDSRCPMDSLILCVWQGRADAILTTTISGMSQSDTLSADGLSNAPVFDSTSFANYKIRLLAIEPYPTTTNSPVPPEDYKLKLLITQ